MALSDTTIESYLVRQFLTPLMEIENVSCFLIKTSQDRMQGLGYVGLRKSVNETEKLLSRTDAETRREMT